MASKVYAVCEYEEIGRKPLAGVSGFFCEKTSSYVNFFFLRIFKVLL